MPVLAPLPPRGPTWSTRPNGGSVRGYQAIFVPLAALSSPGYSPVGGQPAVYLYIAGLEANCPLPPQIGHMFLVFTMRAPGPFRHGSRIGPGSRRARPASASS
jgi:hypothetical protein